MITPLLFLLLQNSFCATKWTRLTILPSSASENECIEEGYETVQNDCDQNSELYGGPEACKDIFNSKVEFTCSRNDNPNVDELLSKIDKSVKILMIYINLNENVTFNFAKLPSRMSVTIIHYRYQGSSGSKLLDSIQYVYNMEHNNLNLLNNKNTNKKVKIDDIHMTKINGNHDDKLASLYVESDMFEIVESPLNIDVFAVRSYDTFYENTKFKVRAKQTNICLYSIGKKEEETGGDGSGSVKLLEDSNAYSSFHHYEYETLSFYDDSFYLDERLKQYYKVDGNHVTFKFGSKTYEINSTLYPRYSVSNDLSKSIGFITGAQKIILVANQDSKIPDNFVLDLKYYNPSLPTIESIDPYLIYVDEEEEDAAKLLEEYKIVITKDGDWTGLKKLKVTIKLTNDKFKLDTTDINDIAEIKIINNEKENKKKGLETKYIIIIVVCCVVVVAVVVVVVVVVLKKKKAKVNNYSASP